MKGLVVLATVVAVVLAFAWWRRRTDGHWQARDSHSVLRATDLGASLGRRATLVQFSTAFCAPCRATRVILASVADEVDGVVAVDVDAESHLDLVRRLDIRRTPTTLVLDASGTVRGRAVGTPKPEHVRATLASMHFP